MIIEKLLLQSNNRNRTLQVFKFLNKLWEFKSEKLNELICEIFQRTLEIDENFIKGFEKLERCLNIYLETSNSSIKNYLLMIFGSITIENGTIIRATSKYHNKPWFSNVSILMNSEELFEYTTDNGLCYGKVLYFKIFLMIYKYTNKNLNRFY